jgi:hypothetical protein
MLTQAIEREGDWKDEEHRDDARTERGVDAEEVPQQRQRAEVRHDREVSLEPDAPAKFVGIGG